jgi:hypothetical protein
MYCYSMTTRSVLGSECRYAILYFHFKQHFRPFRQSYSFVQPMTSLFGIARAGVPSGWPGLRDNFGGEGVWQWRLN